MKHFLCCVALLCLFCSATAQSQPASKGLKVGDQVPEVIMSKMINHTNLFARVSEYRGQLLILDFWATWCSPCVAMFPKTDSLNKVFKGKAVILPVTYQSAEEVTKLFNKATKLKPIKIPMVVSDSKLQALFPHRELPHYVWIDDKGIVKAITGHQEINAANITKMMSSGIALDQKQDREVLPYDRESPLMFNQVEFAAEDLKYESMLTGFKEGFASRKDVLRYPDNSIARYTATNSSLKHLFTEAFSSDEFPLFSNRVLVEVKKNPAAFTSPDYNTEKQEQLRKWEKENLYCYELMVSNNISKDFWPMMQQELRKIFPQYSASLQKRETRYLALVRTSSADKVKTTGSKPAVSMDQFEVTLTNCKIILLTVHFNNMTLYHLNIPVMDETGITDRVDMVLTGNMSDVESIRKQLKKYDLDLVYKTKPIDMLVIADAQ